MNKVLIVDDNAFVRESLGALLEAKSIPCSLASSAAEAIALLGKESGFDMVITDLLMPEISGLGLIGFLREHYPEIPVLAISGGGDITKGETLLLGASKIAHGTLKKPFTADELHTAMMTAGTRAAERSRARGSA